MQFTEKEVESRPASEALEVREAQVWRNGKLMGADEARVSPFDHGVLVGDGIFETLQAYNGEPFAPSRHYCRLQHSAARLGLQMPDEKQLLEAMRTVLTANSFSDARLRITITGGVSPLGSDRGTAEHTLLVAASPVPKYNELGKVITVDFTRNETSALVGVKSTSYGENVIALSLAKKRGADEAIFPNNAGMLCEGTGSNVFIVLDGQLITPTIASGCLAGVTRSVVMDICAELGIKVTEKDVPLENLKQAEEAFLCGSLREVQGIVSVDGVGLPSAPGMITQRVRQAFREFVKRDSDPSADGFRFD